MGADWCGGCRAAVVAEGDGWFPGQGAAFGFLGSVFCFSVVDERGREKGKLEKGTQRQRSNRSDIKFHIRLTERNLYIKNN